jgi:hypothetical protein
MSPDRTRPPHNTYQAPFVNGTDFTVTLIFSALHLNALVPRFSGFGFHGWLQAMLCTKHLSRLAGFFEAVQDQAPLGAIVDPTS